MLYQKYIDNLALIKVLPLILMVFSSCDIINFKNQEKGLKFNDNTNIKPIARAHDQYLYFNDLEGLIPSDISKADSALSSKLTVKATSKAPIVATATS